MNAMNRNTKRDRLRLFVFIEAPLEKVAAEIFRWDKSAWWPRESVLRYIPETPGGMKEGSRYTVKMLIPLADDLKVEVTNMNPKNGLVMEFNEGMLEGNELIILEGRYNGTRVNYILDYTVKGLLRSFIWNVFVKSRYLQSMKNILEHMKRYVNQKQVELEE